MDMNTKLTDEQDKLLDEFIIKAQKLEGSDEIQVILGSVLFQRYMTFKTQKERDENRDAHREGFKKTEISLESDTGQLYLLFEEMFDKVDAMAGIKEKEKVVH